MPFFTKEEIKNKMSGSKSTKGNELKVEIGKQHKLWVPNGTRFFSIKRHFNIKKIPGLGNSKVHACNCINQENDDKLCPICEHVQSIWEEYRNTSKAEDKKKVLQKLNQFTSTYFYLNAIDTDDPDERFVSWQLTESKFKEWLTMFDEDKNPIEDTIFIFKKSKNGPKTEYSLMSITDKSTTDSLKDRLESLENRPLEEGGLNPLEDMYKYDTDEAKHHELLGYVGTGVTKSKPVEKNKPVEKSKVVADKTDIDNIDIDMDDDLLGDEETVDTESVSLDDDLDVSLDDDELNIDDDDLSIDEDEPVTMITITPTYIVENQRDKTIIGNLAKFLGSKIKAGKTHKEMKSAVFAYAKKVKSFEIPEHDLVVAF